MVLQCWHQWTNRIGLLLVLDFTRYRCSTTTRYIPIETTSNDLRFSRITHTAACSTCICSNEMFSIVLWSRHTWIYSHQAFIFPSRSVTFLLMHQEYWFPSKSCSSCTRPLDHLLTSALVYFTDRSTWSSSFNLCSAFSRRYCTPG